MKKSRMPWIGDVPEEAPGAGLVLATHQGSPEHERNSERVLAGLVLRDLAQGDRKARMGMNGMQRKRNVGLFSMLIAVVLAIAFAVPAHAVLERVGPVNGAIGGYPAWYQDSTGLALEFCTPVNQAELNDGWCVILPADVPTGAVPEVPFTNYSGEHFYWLANAGTTAVQGGTGLVLALEAAFNTADPVAGEQVVFGRVRIRIASVPASGDYKVFTPFGDFDFPGLVAGTRLFFTTDIGIGCGADFSCALNSAIGPFLLPSATSGGPEVPPIPDLVAGQDPWYDALAAAKTPYPGTGKKYIADPVRQGPVTGSPLPPFVGNDGVTYDHNRFRIEGPGNTVVVDEPNFSMAGRVMTGQIPGRVTVNRASYTDQTTPTALKKLDVFATAFPTTNPRVPGGGATYSINPDMGFFPAPCATDPVTGAVTGPPTGTGLVYFQMFKSGNNWWGQTAPAVIPPQVCVQNHNARNAAGQVVPAYFLADVTDEVNLTVADWDPTVAGGTLTVQANSSDQVTAPTLTVAGFGPITAGSLTVSDLQGPPDKVSVVSTRGGVATLDVRTFVGIPVSMTTPTANADSVTTNEDTQALDINVLANDTLSGGALPAGATVAITGIGRLGTATINAADNITYTPNPNVNGTDIVGYTVTVPCATCASGTATSNEGYLTIIITPVNDAPTAVNDTGGAPNNKPVTINLLGNDTDPDGAADLAAAVITQAPVAPGTITCNGGVPAVVGTVCTGGLVTFTGAANGGLGGVYTFTYKAQDQGGLPSATAATVTMTVNAVEAIVVTKSIFTGKTWRWTVAGTDSLIAGQTLVITYNIATPPTYKVGGVCTPMTAATNPVIGTATVDGLGNWSYDVLGTSAGTVNPTNTGSNGTGFWCSAPKTVKITSPLGGTANSNISFK